MSDDSILQMYEAQAELIETKQELDEIQNELKRIRKEHEELKNQMATNNLVEIVENLEAKFSEKLETLSLRVCNIKELVTANGTRSIIIKKDLAALSERVSNHYDKFSEISEHLRKLNETLNNHHTISSQRNEILTNQNDTNQALNTSDNSLEKKTILLLSGRDGRCVFPDLSVVCLMMSENNGQNWKRFNIKLPYAVENPGAQFLDNNLYIFGGERTREYLNCTYKLSKKLQWEKMADMKQKCYGISNSSVILNNQIWVCGGSDECGSVKSVEMYDPLTNEWKFMKQMNECRRNAATAVVNRKIFCCGGSNEGDMLNSTEYYDPFSNVWTLICNMPQYVSGHCAVEMDGSFIVMGWEKVWALDTTNKNAIWIEKPSMTILRAWSSIAKIDGKVFICGGHDAGDNVEIFDGTVWRNSLKMPTPRVYASAVVIPMHFASYLY